MHKNKSIDDEQKSSIDLMNFKEWAANYCLSHSFQVVVKILIFRTSFKLF